MLAVDGEELSIADAGRPIVLIDSTWRYVNAMRNCIRGEIVPRSLPRGLETAYPRRSKLWTQPDNGLASIEALYAALYVIGIRDASLLTGYHWRAEFLENLRGSGLC